MTRDCQRAMHGLAEKLTLESSKIVGAARQALLDAGLTDADIWDIYDVTSLFARTNRVASGVGIQPNAQCHGTAR